MFNKYFRDSIRFFALNCILLALLFTPGCDCHHPVRHVTSFPYLTYDSTQISRWLDPTKKVTDFIFQFNSSNINKPDTTSFQLISYVLDSSHNYLNSGYPPAPPPDTLKNYVDSLKTFDVSVTLGNNYISKKDIEKLVKIATGGYDYLVFIPVVDTDHQNHIHYDLRIRKKTSVEMPDFEYPTVDEFETNPSPPKPPPGLPHIRK